MANDQQVRAVAIQILKTWWVWLALAIVVWSGLFLVEGLAHYQSRRFQAELSENSSNQLAQGLTAISNAVRAQVAQNLSNQLRAGFATVSNQIATALEQPQMKASIQDVLSQQATQLMFTAISPAISNFQASLAQAQAQGRAQARVQNPATNTPARAANANPPAAAADSTPPGAIIFDSQSVSRQGPSYVLVVQFRRVGDGSLGTLHFAVGAYNQLPARILAIDVQSAANRDVQRLVDQGGLEAGLNFTPRDGADPAIKLLISGPTIVQVACDALAEPINVPVMMALPGSIPANQ